MTAARKSRGLSLRALAAAMPASLDTVQRLEQGDPGIGLGTLKRALDALGLADRLVLLSEAVAASTEDPELRRLVDETLRDFDPAVFWNVPTVGPLRQVAGALAHQLRKHAGMRGWRRAAALDALLRRRVAAA